MVGLVGVQPLSEADPVDQVASDGSVATTAVDLAQCPWMDTSLSAEERAQLVLDASTLGQKMRWLSEQSANLPEQTQWPQSSGDPIVYEEALPCTPTVYYTDGAEGVRHTGATTFPAQIALAASWDDQLAYDKGAAQGAEAFDLGYSVLLGPGIASGRHPLSGRTPEYLGEDSLLTGTLAGQQAAGIESNPVVANLKHYVANEQEMNRQTSSSNISQRALHEVYALPFEVAIDVGDPTSVMCSYNQINGTFACENDEVLNTILREEIGFDGFVMSDFGSVHSTAQSLNAGLDLELNVPKYYSPENLNAALEAGTITEAQIDNAAKRVLVAYIGQGLFDTPTPTEPDAAAASTDQHKTLARTSAEEGTVLLKNSGVLPLAASAQTIAVIGSSAASADEYAAAGGVGGASAELVCSQKGFSFGGGAALGTMDCADLVSPLTAISAQAQASGGQVVYATGDDPVAAAELAASADVAIVFGYLRMGEFADATSLSLDNGGDALIAAVAAANDATVAVVETGSATDMPWLDEVAAVFEAWYPGEQQGPALVNLLWGKTNPSGKLPMTFPTSLEDSAMTTTEQYPGLQEDGVQACEAPSNPFGGSPEDGICQVNYTEDLAVGYKYYDEYDVDPLFEFGFGLSYTSFDYTGLAWDVTYDTTTGVPAITGSYTLTNTGAVAGDEVPQVYLTLPDSSATPGKRLVAYDRVHLEPGQSVVVSFVVAADDSDHPLSVWDSTASAWTDVYGDYQLAVGSSSRALPLTADLPVSTLADQVAALRSLVDQAQQLDEAAHTADSWAALAQVLAVAQAAIDSTPLSLIQLTSATDQLQAAIEGLEPVSAVAPTADPTADPTTVPTAAAPPGASAATGGSVADGWDMVPWAICLLALGLMLVGLARARRRVDQP
jgi:beta-glucosidase